MDATLDGLVRPAWPPMQHVAAGWDALTEAQRAEVMTRVDGVLARHRWGDHDRKALRTLFSFLAQVETIAIEIPLRFRDHAPAAVRPLLDQQLVDEVFHSVLFARLAHDLSDGHPPAPYPSAERLLQRIRDEPDLAVSATMLNLVAEGWIENLFRHAACWGIADHVFATVLADESRHVHEATEYMVDLDATTAASAVAMLEEGLMKVGAEPAVGLAMVHLAGVDRYRDMIGDLHHNHAAHLAQVGLRPSAAWQQMTRIAVAGAQDAADSAGETTRLDDTPWRKAARNVWDTPRDPTMQGEFEVAVGHIPKRDLTPILVAAIGRAWADNPRLNKVLAGDRIVQLKRANVGVRVLLAEDELATVVIQDADQRSVRDIRRMILDGVSQLRALRDHRPDGDAPAFDPDLGRWMPPSAHHFSVALSNPGRFGLVSGAGAFSGAVAPSTDFSVGQRRRLPVWRGVGYFPAWHVSIGALQDHRIFDGEQAGLAMSAMREALCRSSVRAIRRAPDSLPERVEAPTYDDAWVAALPPQLRMLPQVGIAKYVPWAIGGATLGGAAAVGGYYLYTALNATQAAAEAAAAGSAGAAAGSAAGTAAASSAEGADDVGDDEPAS